MNINSNKWVETLPTNKWEETFPKKSGSISKTKYVITIFVLAIYDKRLNGRLEWQY